MTNSNEFDFVGALSIIDKLVNPEFWHAKNKSHPGIGWSIKTVFPKAEYADDLNMDIIVFWTMVTNMHVPMTKVTEETYDWNGNVLDEWNTVWIRDGWDIEVIQLENGALSHKLTSATRGNSIIAAKLLDTLREQLAQSTNPAHIQELEELIETCEIMSSFATEQDSQAQRKNLKVIDD